MSLSSFCYADCVRTICVLWPGCSRPISKLAEFPTCPQERLAFDSRKRFHLEQERAFAELLERERLAAEGGAEIEWLHRERDALRQQNSRTCRKYGLKSRRQRGNG